MDEKRGSVWAGLSVIGAFVTGIVGFLAGILAILNEFDYAGAGLCFLATALAFGLLANAFFRQ